jgi:hypothetical protein
MGVQLQSGASKKSTAPVSAFYFSDVPMHEMAPVVLKRMIVTELIAFRGSAAAPA